MYVSQTDHDTSLTIQGLAQATDAGKHFKQKIEAVQAEHGITFDEVRIQSSPFVRCLQTASQLAKELSVNKIDVNYRVCETLYGGSFDEANALEGGLLANLELKKMGAAALKDTALGGVNVVDTNDWYTEATQLYPEDDDTLPVRYNLVTDYFKNFPVPQGKSICIVVVSHAAFNLELPRRFNAKEESALGLIYCSSFQALIKVNADGSR